MALTNVFREPHREIIETLVGLAVILFPVYLDYKFAHYLVTTYPKGAPSLIVAMICVALVIIIGTAVSIGLMLLIHLIGEKVCDFLQTRDIHLRPLVRR